MTKLTKPQEVYLSQVDFTFRLTSDEAYEILKNPKGKVAKGLRKYFTEFLNEVAKKCLAYEKKEKESQDE